MGTTKPQITRLFEEDIKQKAERGTYYVELDGIRIEVFPYVFPPTSPFSESSRDFYNVFGDLTGRKVLDLGTGTGIQAIRAAKMGALEVDAADISQAAVECARHNVLMNNYERRINVLESDMFSNVPGRYDLIIANLPILDYPEKDPCFYSLSDPNFKYHNILFDQGHDYLNSAGRIVLSHANLQQNGFERLEKLASKNDFHVKTLRETKDLGYTWRQYGFTSKRNMKGGEKR